MALYRKSLQLLMQTIKAFLQWNNFPQWKMGSILFLNFYFILEHTWLIMLYWFWVYNKVIQLYTACIYSFSNYFPIQCITEYSADFFMIYSSFCLFIYFKYSVYVSIPNSQFISLPPFPTGKYVWSLSLWVFSVNKFIFYVFWKIFHI